MFSNCPGTLREVGANEIGLWEVRPALKDLLQDKLLTVSTSFCLALISSCPL